MKALPTDIYDGQGNLLKIEYQDEAGKRIVDAIWDENDEQTSDNRESFRKWASNMLERMGYEVAK